MSDINTAEYRKLALIAAGVSLQNIPSIIDTATWRNMMIAALLQNTANQAIIIKVSEIDQASPPGGGYLDIAALQVEANTKYLIEAHYIYFSIGFGGGPWARVLCPSGTTGGGSVPFVLNNTGSISYYINNNWLNTPSTPPFTDASIGNSGAKGAGSINGFIQTGSVSGSVKMQLRPYASGNSFTVYAGSFLKLEKYS